MAGASSGTVMCPHCGKPFKRLKTHLPHCKMAVKGKTAPVPEKVLSLSATAAKPRPIKTQPNGKLKKQRTYLPAATHTQSVGVAKKDKTEVTIKKKKTEHMESKCPADIKTSTNTLIEKAHSETKRPVKVSKITLKGLTPKKQVPCDPTETTHSKETYSQECALLSHNEGSFRTEETMLTHSVKVSSPATVGLRNRIDIDFSDSIKPHAQEEKVALISQEKQEYALLPTTVLQSSIHGKQTLLPEVSECDNISNYNSCTTKWNSKNFTSEDNLNADAVSIKGKRDQRDAFHTYEEEHCEKMSALHLDKSSAKASIWIKEKETRDGAIKTSLWENIKGPMVKGTNRSIGDTSFNQKLEPEIRTLVEDKLLKDSAENLISASDSFSVLQKIGHTWRSADTGQERGRTVDCVVCLQQAPANEQQTLPISSLHSLKDRDGEVLTVQKNEKTSCVDTQLKHELTYLQETVCRHNIQMDSVGLQWLPDFYSSYQELGVVPGKCHRWDANVSSTEYVCHPKQQPAPPSEQRLMNMTLGELPFWLSSRPISAREITGATQRAWGRYYNKYINVKRGGIGGITMLLAGYCVLSYAWNYKHIKQDRWRKYH
ncbi:mitochondrial nucleoid-associated protein 1 [Lissotriton helveticus]